jgi:CMP-N,N'-diacetyllegionaminic acid synthase
MINGLKVLSVIPARGGSKGVPLKNLRKVGGVPLVEIAAKVACEVDLIDRIVVSTDHEEIVLAAINGGADAPFRRLEELSGDRVSDKDVLVHALQEMERIDDVVYDIIIMLQPTSPLRKAEDVSNAIQMLVDGQFDSVWTVTETDSKSHPLKQMTIQNSNLEYYDQVGIKIIARQQLEPVFHRNGIAYAISRDCLINQNSIKGKNTGVIINKGNHISIDTEFDIELVEFILSRNQH